MPKGRRAPKEHITARSANQRHFFSRVVTILHDKRLRTKVKFGETLNFEIRTLKAFVNI